MTDSKRAEVCWVKTHTLKQAVPEAPGVAVLQPDHSGKHCWIQPLPANVVLGYRKLLLTKYRVC